MIEGNKYNIFVKWKIILELDAGLIGTKLPALKQLHLRENPICEREEILRGICNLLEPKVKIVIKWLQIEIEMKEKNAQKIERKAKFFFCV